MMTKTEMIEDIKKAKPHIFKLVRYYEKSLKRMPKATVEQMWLKV